MIEAIIVRSKRKLIMSRGKWPWRAHGGSSIKAIIRAMRSAKSYAEVLNPPIILPQRKSSRQEALCQMWQVFALAAAIKCVRAWQSLMGGKVGRKMGHCSVFRGAIAWGMARGGGVVRGRRAVIKYGLVRASCQSLANNHHHSEQNLLKISARSSHGSNAVKRPVVRMKRERIQNRPSKK